MARLNEVAAAPVESIETLRRKFLRQNRELARINSSQSLRIRQLENEISRTLTENLELREQIIKLDSEAEKNQSNRLLENVGEIRAQLETKLFELGALVTGLTDLPAPQRKSQSTERTQTTNPNLSPEQKQWRNMCTLSEAMAGQEGRLPPILENKYYPRRTLDAEEITAIVSDAAADTTDSPEIGSPPVSQFVNEDPVKIDLPVRTTTPAIDQQPVIDTALSTNLEQRKRRRDNSGVSELKRGNRFVSNTSLQAMDPPTLLKTGAKRKLSVRDDDEPSNTTEVSSDDFKYTRKSIDEKSQSKVMSADQAGARVIRELASARGASREKTTDTVESQSATRKALGPKTTNNDVKNSPQKKNTKALNFDEIALAKLDLTRKEAEKDKPRERRRESMTLKPSLEPVVTSMDIHPEPETPAALDIFSPPSTEQSTARVDSRDTPPPTDLGAITDGHRPSRRARGAVSYAEPNLRDKMRRPTKELVDAVIIEERNRAINAKAEGQDPAVRIKAEAEADDAWKNMPTAQTDVAANSPLSSKTTGIEKEDLAEVITQRRRRISGMHQADGESQSNSKDAMAALMASSRKLRTEEQGDIYDFSAKSPPRKEEGRARSKEDKSTSRNSRRHSSIPKHVDVDPQDSGEVSDIETTVKPRRRQSAMSNHSRSGSDVTKGTKRVNSTMEGGENKVASRRRSMVL